MHASMLSQFAWTGDHHCFILDFTSVLLIRDVFPNIVTSNKRKIKCGSDSPVRNYTTALDQLCDHHQMFKKVLDVRESSPLLTTSNFMLLTNKWDKELNNHMKSADNTCHTCKDGCIK